MEILRGPSLQRFEHNLDRVSDDQMLSFPDHFRDERLRIRRGTHYTLIKSVEVNGGNSTFWNMRLRTQLLPHGNRDKPPTVIANGHAVPTLIENTRTAWHNIEITDGEQGVGVNEHHFALQSALDLPFDLEVETVGTVPLLRRTLRRRMISLPTYSNCDQPYIDAIAGNLREDGKTRFVTVREPVGFRFAKGSYIILKPDDGENVLSIDNEVNYSHLRPIGRQRLRDVITPGLFTFLASARTVATGARVQLMKFLSRLGSRSFPGTTLGLDNVLAIEEQSIVNPHPKFQHGGVDYELAAHQFIDKLGWLQPLETSSDNRRFVGDMTFSRTSHTDEVAVAQALCRDGALQGTGGQATLDVEELRGKAA